MPAPRYQFWRSTKGVRTAMKSGSRVTDEVGPALCIVAIIATLGGGSYYALFSLSKPTVYPNPGVEAYHLPEATRILPLPRVSDAPDIAVGEGSSGAESATTAVAQASAAPQPPPKDATPTRKAAHSSRRAIGTQQWDGTQRWGNSVSSQAWNSFGYVRQWDSPYRNNSYSAYNNGGYANGLYARDLPARSRMGGGPKSPF